jgi:hypothetical protein
LAKEINDYLNNLDHAVPNMRSDEPHPRNPDHD